MRAAIARKELESMLRISRHDDSASRVTLKLEGRLVAKWAAVLERECSTLLESGAAVELDLSGVVVLDRAGVAALERLHRAGIEVRGCSDIIASVLESEGVPVRRNGCGPNEPGV